MKAYNPLDYRYSFNVPKETLRQLLQRQTILICPTAADVLNSIDENDNVKTNISHYITSHDNYLDSRSPNDRNLVHLWTNPEICAAFQRILRGIGQNGSRDLEYLNAILELRNGDIIQRANDIRRIIRSKRTNQEKNDSIREMLMIVLNHFVLALTEIVMSSPSIPFRIMTFRGISGNIVAKYRNLPPNNIILERGFTSVTWQPLKAVEYAIGENGNNPSAYLMCIYLHMNTRALSVFTVSAYPNDREFLLPAGTVILKRPNGFFEVIGIYQKFLNRSDPNVSPYTGWLGNINPSPTNYLDQHEADLIPTIMGAVTANYRFGVVTGSSAGTKKRPSMYESTQRPPLEKMKSSSSISPQRKQNTDLPPGVSVEQVFIENGTDPINVVDLDLKNLFQTHTVETIINEKGGSTTFFTQR